MSKQLYPTVVDLETSVNCPIGNNKANPHWPDNKVVLAGYKHVGQDRTTTAGVTDSFNVSFRTANSSAYHRLWVGVNLPFDLQYMYKEVGDAYKDRHNTFVWDCQLAEYILTSQQSKYASLDEMSKKYGGTVKDGKIKAYWDRGVKTEHIPIPELTEYLKSDVNNTCIVYKAQVQEAIKRKMMPLIMAQMDAVLAITDMQYHGIAVDQDFVKSQIDDLVRQIAIQKGVLITMAIKVGVPLEHINIDSPKSLSLILFGGEVKDKVNVANGLYKNGNIRYTTKEVVTNYKGYGLDTTGIEKTVHGYSTDEGSLSKHMGCPFVSELLNYKSMMKEYGTYYSPMLNFIFPDGRIHHSLHQSATNTGRLSSSEPNLQNVPSKEDSEVKKAYVSRWGENGRLVEADYRQLEIVALAYLSGDRQLIKDINDGLDIHTELYRSMYSRTPTDTERRAFKRLSFALIYGAGVKNMAERGGVTIALAKRFKEAFFARYPQVKDYRDHVAAEVRAFREIGGHGHDKVTGLPLASSQYTLPTGRELYFREYVSTYTGTPVAQFSYTEQCNYPIQSFATGDIVPIMLGRLWRRLGQYPLLSEKVLLINTVHDSVLLDVRVDKLDEACTVIKDCLEEVPQVMKELFNIDMRVKVPVSLGVGTNWHNIEEKK